MKTGTLGDINPMKLLPRHSRVLSPEPEEPLFLVLPSRILAPLPSLADARGRRGRRALVGAHVW